MESAADCKTFNFLTRDGAVAITFPAELTAEQYAQLLQCVIDCETKQQVKEYIAIMTNGWSMTATIDDGA